MMRKNIIFNFGILKIFRIADSPHGILKLISMLLIFSFIFFSHTGALSAGSAKKVRIGINPLKAEGVDQATADKITLMIFKSLSAEKGADRVVYRKVSGVSKSTNRQLIGSVSSFGSSYFISVRVVEGEKAKILFSKAVTVKKEKIEKAVKKIADDLIDCVEIWE